MPAVAVVPGDVTLLSTDKPSTQGIAGEAYSAGDMVYRKVSDGRWWQAVATVDMSDSSVVSGQGIALEPANAAGDRASIAAEQGSRVDLGAATDKDKTYYPGGTAGQLVEYSDLTVTTHYLNRWGFGESANNIFVLWPQASGLTK